MKKKRIVVACDGTGNRPENLKRTSLPTNVVKTCRAVEQTGSDGTPQFIYYIPGIGTHPGIERYLSQMTGKGIDDNIEWAYAAVAHNYEHGDDIFLFGFSRGAFSVRSLASFLFHIGILHKQSLDKFPDAYHRYQRLSRDPDDKSRMISLSELQREVEPRVPSVPIRFLGVWDTVGALGDEEASHEIDLTSNVTHAYQALALHEFRSDFWPELWASQAHTGQIVEQVWFPGGHSDIGGGAAQSGLSVWPFMWMVAKAAAAGLEFDLSYLFIHILPDQNVLAPIQLPSRWWGRRPKPFLRRPIGAGIEESRHETVDYRKAAGISYGTGADWEYACTKWRFQGRIDDAHTRAYKLRTAPELEAGKSQQAQDIMARLKKSASSLER